MNKRPRPVIMRDSAVHNPDEELLGRAEERAALQLLAMAVRGGASRLLVVRGDAGIGKTALLDELASGDHGLAVTRLSGSEAEANLPFAAIQRLTHSAGSVQENLPAPQLTALRVAAGLEVGAPPDRFLVGLAVHSLLVESATTHPTLLLVDDAHWLDQESIDALAFAARRLGTEGVGMVVSHRKEQPLQAFQEFPTLDVDGLPATDALNLLRRVVERRLEQRICDQIVTATGGNPLAIMDLAQELSTHQLVGLTMLPEPLPIGSHLEAHYLRQTRAFPVDVQTWLLLAAAEPTGDPAYVASAAAVLGIDVHAADLAEAADLVTLGSTIEFRHPLVRSAIYTGAAGGQRRRVHNALGAVIRRERDVDRRAWHLAAACVGTDETVALLLEQAAERARERGGYSARASFLARAVGLTPEGQARIRRSIAAADAALMAGRALQTFDLLDTLDDAELDDISRGRSLMIRASAQAFSGQRGAMATIPAICVAAAAAFEATAPQLARDALLTAFERSTSAEWMMTGTTLTEIADRSHRLGLSDSESLPDLILTALANLVTAPIQDAVPHLQRAVAALASEDAPTADVLRFGWLGAALTTALWDDQSRERILGRTADLARSSGALSMLDTILFVWSLCETVLGQLASAAAHLDELHRVRTTLGVSPEQQEMFKNAEYLAWRGDDGALRENIAQSSRAAVALGMGGAETLARTGLMIVDISAGNYQEAYEIAQHIRDLSFMGISIRVLPDLVETAARSGRVSVAQGALDDLRRVATASGTDWSMGVLERSAGVLAEHGDPEQHYAVAIDHLSRCRARADLARTHLLYGEWLRRQRRRHDARIQLRAALQHFDEMGAGSFAARARRELAATGGSAVRETRGTPGEPGPLTTQERAVAELAAQGGTNAEIARTLVVSPHTVDYHLRKIYQKLGVSSRRQLAAALRE